uniref:Fibroleukin-like n=1 Tax=Crassostrea virginica TaxID=6565 RepID=A0A8B8BVX7_CRAVI|nr:fibroleukin-like [Crassostrea virginica]
MITDFSNRVQKTSLTEVSEFSSKTLLECGMKFDQFCGCFGYNTQTQVCRVFKTCSMNGPMEYEEGWIYYFLDKLSEKVEAENCQDIFEKGYTTSGIYTIYPWDKCDKDFRAVDVFCDMETLGGGWTVLQRRNSGSTSFNQTWNKYKIGFGSLNETFWIGNDVIHQLTRHENATLYVAITLVNGTTLHQMYRRFSVADEADKFRLFLQEPVPNGTLGDSMVNTGYSAANLHGMPFSTSDQNNDPRRKCGSIRGSGWWFNDCAYANLNVLWESMHFAWYPVVRYGTDLRGTLMMIRPN